MAVVKINAIRVPAPAGPELERRFAARAHTMEGVPGFLGFQLLRPVAGEERYFVVTQWADDDAFAAWRDGDARAAHAAPGGSGGPGGSEGADGAQQRPVSSGADLLEFEVVLDVAGGA